MEDLKELQRLVSLLEKTNSSNEKKAILKRFPQCQKILNYTYNSFKNYYVSSENLIKMNHLNQSEANFENIYDLLDELDNRTITGHDAIAAVNQFISRRENYPYVDLIYKILDRNLKVRTDTKLINKVFPGCIPTFDVALANKFDDQAEKVDFQKDKWFASHKLDGVRVITIIDKDGDIHFFSRKGKEFTTLDKVKDAIQKIGLRNTVLDGEMCIVDKNGKEDFNSIIKEIRKKDHTIKNPKYKLFDFLHLDVFLAKKGGARLEVRLDQLRSFIDGLNSPILEALEQKPIPSMNFLKDFMDYAQENSWEGLIIRKNTPYEGKRSNNMLKMKKFLDGEYIVEDAIMGPIQFIEDGKQKEEVMLSAITIRHKGYPVSVGSGFTIKFRQEAYNNPAMIKGKTVTVAYFEETKNKQGTISLRFPTVKTIYDGERDM